MLNNTLQEFKDILSKIEDKIDKNSETIGDIKIELNRINHDLYGNGKPGLFEEFNKIKTMVYENKRYLWGLSSLLGLFIAFKDYFIGFFNNK
jgi:hypothetical protein